MPIVTFTISALPPFFRNTTLASFSRFFLRYLFRTPVDDLRVAVGLFCRCATFCFSFRFLLDFKLLSPVRMVRLASARPRRLSPRSFGCPRQLERRLEFHVVIFDSNFSSKLVTSSWVPEPSASLCYRFDKRSLESPIVISISFLFRPYRPTSTFPTTSFSFYIWRLFAEG